ncbi:MAG: sodium:alanine symporter family protein [Ruminococcus sp.]|nr:sodium:alanine symporter family protein [Ruminococcus sp.]
MNDIILAINGYLWGLPMIAFLFCTHLFMTVRTGFVQRKTLTALRLSVIPVADSKKGVSPFQALSASLASTLGTGNIIGVGTAVAMGGAGAVFWCWITGILGMATQYAECMLAVKFRQTKPDGSHHGGTMYVLRDGVGSKKTAVVYAFLAAVCGLLTGAAIQSNAVANVVVESLGHRDRMLSIFGTNISVIKVSVGVLTAVITSLVIFGGAKVIARVCSRVVPFMAVIYMLGCGTILFINRAVLLQTLSLIIREAFSLSALGGGMSGSVMMIACRFGIARGLLSNEAGLGTSSVISAGAVTPNPVRQGLVAMTATFWDTVVMCLVTGVVIVSTILSLPAVQLDGVDGSGLCYLAFSRIPIIGEELLVFGMITFAVSTVLGWSWIGLECAEFVFGQRVRRAYLILWVAMILIAPVVELDVVWNVADLCNALLAVPNVYALVMLNGQVHSETAVYINNPELKA